MKHQKNLKNIKIGKIFAQLKNNYYLCKVN